MTARTVLSILTCGLLLSSLPQAAMAQKNNNNNKNKNQNVHVNRNVQVNRNVHAQPAKKNVVVKNNKTVVQRNVTVKKVVYVKPYRAYAYRPYYGTIIGGVALGTIIGVSAAYAVPVRPASNLCWYWADPAGYRGYWDYCTIPY